VGEALDKIPLNLPLPKGEATTQGEHIRISPLEKGGLRGIYFLDLNSYFKYLPIIGARSFLTCSGISSREVIMAFSKAEAQIQFRF